MTKIQCPHVSVADLAETWDVSKRTIQRWLADDGIVPVRRGRYRLSDIERYAEKNGKPKYTKMESWELSILKKENENLKLEIENLKNKLIKVAVLAVNDMAEVVLNKK